MAGSIGAVNFQVPGPEDAGIRAAEILRNRAAVETSQIEQTRFDQNLAGRAAIAPAAAEGPTAPAAPLPIDRDLFNANPVRNLNPAELSPDEVRFRFGIGRTVNAVDFAPPEETTLEAIAARGEAVPAALEPAVRNEEIAAPDLAAALARQDVLLTQVSTEGQRQRSEDLSALAGIVQNDPARPAPIAPPPLERGPIVVERTVASAPVERSEEPLRRVPERQIAPGEEAPTPEAVRNFGVGVLVNAAA